MLIEYKYKKNYKLIIISFEKYWKLLYNKLHFYIIRVNYLKSMIFKNNI